MLQQPWVEALCGLNGLTHTALQDQLLDLCRGQEHGSELGTTDLVRSCMPAHYQSLAQTRQQLGGLVQSGMPS